MKLEGATPYWLGTDGVLAGIGPAGETCSHALRVDAPWETTIGWISLDDPKRSVIIRQGSVGRIDVHSVSCTPSIAALPAAAARYEDTDGHDAAGIESVHAAMPDSSTSRTVER